MTGIFVDFDVSEENGRLLEKSLYRDLTEDERSQLPAGMGERFTAHIRRLVDKARRDVEAGRAVDGPTALQRMRERLIEKKIDRRK